MASPTQQITGLASGMDTASIVEQLMAVERLPYQKLDVKKQTEQLKLQAYQAVNTQFLAFKNAIANLSSQAFWKAKTATSSNEKSLLATATQYAAAGSYSFRVGQLATTAQYMSKGFSNSKSTIISSNSGVTGGTITLNSAKARIDNSAKLESLNGGRGVFRGSIRITDAGGSSAMVDVSACETINDVITAINNAGGVQVKAQLAVKADGTIDGSRLEVVDQSGGGGALRIQNVGQGTAATDLGIAGASTGSDKTITGKNIFYMTNDTALANLRDGLGVENGMISLEVKNGSDTMEVIIDVSKARTVGDVLDAANSAIKAAANSGDAKAYLAQDLKLELNADKNGFVFTGGKAGRNYTLTNIWGADAQGNAMLANPQTANQLGLFGTFHLSADGTFGGAKLLGSMNSPMLKNLTGANSTGIGTTSGAPTGPAALSGSTLLKDLNGGAGLDVSSPFQIKLYEGGGESYRLISDLLDADYLRALATTPNATMNDLLTYVNDRFANSGVPALAGATMELDPASKGVYLSGLSSAHSYEFAGTLANSLGLIFNGNGNSANGWGAKIEADPAVAGGTALTDLYSVKNIGPDGGGTMIVGNEKLKQLDYDLADPATDRPAALASLLAAGSISVQVGANPAVNIDLSGLTEESTVTDMINAINDQMRTSGLPSVPLVDIDWNSKGLVWRNVDLGENLVVTGAGASLLGIDKNYSAQTIATVDTEAQKNLNPVTTGTTTPTAILNGTTLAELRAGQGLSLNGTSLTFTFGPDGGTQDTVTVTHANILDAIAATGHTGPLGSLTVDKYQTAMNSAIAKAMDDKFGGGVAGAAAAAGYEVKVGFDSDSKLHFYVKAPTAETPVAIGGDMATAASTGLMADKLKTAPDPSQYVASAKVADIRPVTTTPVSIDGLGYIKVNIGGTDIKLKTDNLTSDNTLDDLISVLNKQLSDLGYTDMLFTHNTSGSGIAFENNSADKVVFSDDSVNSLASDLGLVKKGDTTEVSAYSYYNGGSVGRKYVDRATSLSTLNGGKGMDKGVIGITNSQGTKITIDLSYAETIGDVIDAINGSIWGVKARINDTGDGIYIYEAYDSANYGKDTGKGDIIITDEGGTNTAKHLGILGTGTGGKDGLSVLNGSMKTVVKVSDKDTLEDIMYRISQSNAGYTTSIINDGSGLSPYRLSITSGASGEGSDFIIDSDLDVFGFQQTARGKNSLVLYGDPNSGVSPILLSSSTNTNSQAISGITLDLKAVTSDYTTITIDVDKSKVTEELKTMVQAYNDLNDLVAYLDSYDAETNQPGVLFGDTSLRSLMSSIDDMFYQVYNPDQLSYSEIGAAADNSRRTWTWMDLGISFSANNSKQDGTGSWYSRMELDLDAFDSMLASNWDVMYSMMASQRNASDSTLSKNVAASASFNFKKHVEGESDPNNAINGDNSSTNFGSGNGFVANDTIKNGENQYTVYFQRSTTLSRLSIYHPNSSEMPASEYALKDFTVEYLDSKTGKWEVMREITNNSTNANYLGFANPTEVLGIRITAKSTNAADGKFRLLDVQAFEDTGLAGKMNYLTKGLADTQDGFLASRTTEVKDRISALDEQMTRLNERLDSKETALWRQFTAMETAMSQLQNQGNYFTSMMSSLSGSSSKK